ncbi:hypothetical protein COEREDRAFT_83320 [Coemansia reversa NRRL 1564]|uniref:HAUS augmin-like complex subunit 1 n=1 Tax=Coemansia reversa (strain ATCC 12441 / NRRL 1564) TaxID=763665 RepID=A0A2G5B3Z7_COERN|nr:hypothetical protein COEREDRAFT_83320 [Coemansia reversa NRRL 1564]|eukprot:PIA13721.1 hypothetical protein COEREDRAFT_83320 [Coemansia reversa NRRL 1564]
MHATKDTQEPRKQGMVSWEIIDSWLKKLYAPSLPPLIPKNPEMQQRLSQLYYLDFHTNEVHDIAEAVQSEAVREYTALGNLFAEILQAAGITLAGLPPSTSKALSELSKVANDLGLADMRAESFERAVAVETMAGFKRQSELDLIQEQTTEVQCRIKHSHERRARIQKLLDERTKAAPIEEQKAREWERNADIVSQKVDEYRERLSSLNTLNNARQVRERGLEYTQIHALDAAVEALRRSVEEKQNAYDGYSALPPDISLAKLKLEEAKQKLEQLRIECEHAVDAAFSTGTS